MTVFRLVLMSAEGTRFVLRARGAEFGGTRAQVLDMLNGDYRYYRNRPVFRYEISYETNSIVVYVA